MWQGLFLLPRRHGFYVLELKHPLLQKRSHLKSPDDLHNHVHSTPKKRETNLRAQNSYRRDALGEQELLERHPHELAIHEEVEGLRLVVRLACGTEGLVQKNENPRDVSSYRGED